MGHDRWEAVFQTLAGLQCLGYIIVIVIFAYLQKDCVRRFQNHVEQEMSEVTDRSDPGLRKIKPNGQQESYLVLSKEEREKGFVRPVRTVYKHAVCGQDTIMSIGLAETYARQPDFYNGTFCAKCMKHFPLMENDVPNFFWLDGTAVGS